MWTTPALVWLLAASASAGPATGWQPFGPERGHVVDAAVGERRVSVATRVEVLSADPALSVWARDPRFPPDTRRLVYGPDGTGWAATPGQLWRVKRDAELVAAHGDGSHAVDLAVTGDGTLIAAVRGQAQGIWRVSWSKSGVKTERVLTDQDPWCVIARGDDVFVGTIDGGLWSSDDGGRDFDLVVTGEGVSALGWVGDRAWAALTDGRIVDGARGKEVARLARGWATSLADAGDRVLATVEGPGHVPPLVEIQDGVAAVRTIPDLEPGTSLARPTGVWDLAGDDVLMGTFRLGPLLVSGDDLAPARTGFRSGVIGGAASGPAATLLVALMGTGVYERLADGSWRVQSGSSGPVTDAVDVADLGTGTAVLDFEGVAWRGSSGRWSRLKGVEVRHTGRRNALIDVGVDAAGAWWAVDVKGALYQATASGWQRCTSAAVSRLDGQGEHLVAAGKQSFLALVDCGVAPLPTLSELRVSPPDSRVIGPWLAAPGQLVRDGAKVAGLPAAPVVAVATRGEEVLVASADGTLSLCTDDGCVPAAPATREPAAAIGWLPDGRIWLAEARGTLLVTGGTEEPTARSDVALHERPQVDVKGLETAPWSREGVAGNAATQADDVLPSHVKEVPGPGQRSPVEAPSWQQEQAGPQVTPGSQAPVSSRWWWGLLLIAVVGGLVFSRIRSRR
jgi:hypothetical protein